MDTLLVDRQTYKEWADFWPTSKRLSDEHPWFRKMSEFAEMVPKVVIWDPAGRTTLGPIQGSSKVTRQRL